MKAYELIKYLEKVDEDVDVLIDNGDGEVHIDEAEIQKLSWGRMKVVLK